MAETQRGQHMIREIREQPQAVSRLLAAEQANVWALAEGWRRRRPRFLLLAARGTSDHAALYGKYLFETVNGIPVGLAAPSVVSIYGARLELEGALVVGISQSGEAADVTAVLQQARSSGADTLAITNNPSSPLAAAAQHALSLHAGPEVAVAATKTYLCTLASLLLLSAAMADDGELRACLESLPGLLADTLEKEDRILARVERFRFLEECVVLGRGYNLSTAYELALKLRETSYIRAQPFASPDFVHGPIAILEEGYPVIAFANEGPALATLLQVITEAQARRAEVTVIGNGAEALRQADVAVSTDLGRPVPEVISPFPSILAGQLLAYGIAVLKGHDPDQPRGLRKVTVTR